MKQSIAQMAENNHGGKRAGAGAKPIGPSPLVRKTVTISRDDIVFLQSIDPNLSAAIRQLIAQSQGS